MIDFTLIETSYGPVPPGSVWRLRCHTDKARAFIGRVIAECSRAPNGDVLCKNSGMPDLVRVLRASGLDLEIVR